jgi:hypothetical protein
MEEIEKPQVEEKPRLPRRKLRIKVNRHDKRSPFRRIPVAKTYNAYCKAKKVRKVDKVAKEDIDKIIYTIFKKIRDNLIEKDGGVMVSHFGYFGSVRTYGNKTKRYGRKRSDVFLTPWNEGMRLRIIYFPYKKDPLLRFWSMDFSFSRKVYLAIRNNIRKGKKYKSYFFSLRRLLGDSIESPYRKGEYFLKNNTNEQH